MTGVNGISADPTLYHCIGTTDVPYCIDGVYRGGSTVCSKCGYGRLLNVASNACECSGVRSVVRGGCTSIPKCGYVRYPNSTT